jgi:hypothetical protein
MGRHEVMSNFEREASVRAGTWNFEKEVRMKNVDVDAL